MKEQVNAKEIEKEEQESWLNIWNVIAVVSFLCTATLFAIPMITTCEGFLCNMEYIVFGMLSIPFTLLSLAAAITKNGTYIVIGVLIALIGLYFFMH